MKFSDKLVGMALVAFGLWVLLTARGFPQLPGQMIGPGTFPTLLGSLCALGGLAACRRSAGRPRIFFFIAFFSFAGENWIVAGMPPHRQFFLLLVMIAFLTYAVTHSTIRWIPAWWFPFIEMGSASGVLAYLTRRMTQPGKALAQIGILFLVVLGFLMLSTSLGFWDMAAPGVGSFWTLGYFSDPRWLLWFMVACSVSYALLIQLRNWPFTRIPMPWGGILACLFCAAVTTVVTAFLASLVGSVFSDMNEALTYAYMGTHWSFVIALLFGFGLDRPYLWAGQKTPGSWEDVD